MTALPLCAIRRDGGTQPRAETDHGAVQEYVSAMADGATFPPVVVFHDGQDNWLADGFHRFAAADAAGASHIDADVRQGTQRDAILHSVGANAEHGLRRSNEDKRRAVQRLLDDPEWSRWSNVAIARACKVDEGLVRRMRPVTSDIRSEDTSRTYVTKHGTIATMDTARIGRQHPDDAAETEPSAEIPQIYAPAPDKPEEAMDPTSRRPPSGGEILGIFDRVEQALAGLPPVAEAVNLIDPTDFTKVNADRLIDLAGQLSDFADQWRVKMGATPRWAPGGDNA